MVAGLAAFSNIISLVVADNLLDSSILLQAKKKSKDRSHNVYDREDCTNKPIWLWLGGHREIADESNMHLWVKQSASEFSSGSSVRYTSTRGGSCKAACAKDGLECVRGMDDAHHQSKFAEKYLHEEKSRCTLWPAGHNRKTQDEAGCLQNWGTQMCACAGTKTLPMNNVCTKGEEEDDTIRFRACQVSNSNPNDPYDTTHPTDFLLRADPLAKVDVEVNDKGNFEISSDDSTIITPGFTVEGGPKTGRQLVLPPSFRFHVKPILSQSQTFTIVERSALVQPDLQSLVISTTPTAPIEFTLPPKFKVNGDNVEIEMSATANIVNDCIHRYTLIKGDSKCKYQNFDRLWRRTNQSLESCYQLCASTPDCLYFSHDDVSHRWKGCCMGCTKVAQPGPHMDFNFYEVCKRSDVRGQCEVHDEHICKDKDENGVDIILNETTVETGSDCHEACNQNGDCKLFAYQPSNKKCQLCKDHHVFKGNKKNDPHSAVMAKDCANEEVAAKFPAAES